MDNNKEWKVDRMNNAFYTYSTSEAAYEFSIWLGAVVIYFLLIGKTPFDQIDQKKYRFRNLIIGYGLHLILVAGYIYLLYWSEMNNGTYE